MMRQLLSLKVELSNVLKQVIVSYRYATKIRALKANGSTVNVAFLVNENQKWSCDSLYKALHENPRFNPCIAVTKLPRDSIAAFNGNIKFFRDKGYEVVAAYDLTLDRPIPLVELDSDIIFFQQPFGFEYTQTPYEASEHSLVCYVPYGLMIANNTENHYRLLFQKLLWRYFAPNELIKKLYMNSNKATSSRKVVALGHPKMDAYGDAIAIKEDCGHKKTIIYAPHHSFEKDGPLRYATFEWNGLEILELAKSDEEFEWVFKPHPRLKHALIKNSVMTQEQADLYYNQWAGMKNGKLMDSGDYFSLFDESDCLITDCGSFIAEYLPTGNPVILLVSEDSAGYNPFGNEIVSHYYSAHDLNELYTIYREVVVEGDDVKKGRRTEAAKTLKLDQTNAGKLITQYITSTLTK